MVSARHSTGSSLAPTRLVLTNTHGRTCALVALIVLSASSCWRRGGGGGCGAAHSICWTYVHMPLAPVVGGAVVVSFLRVRLLSFARLPIAFFLSSRARLTRRAGDSTRRDTSLRQVCAYGKWHGKKRRISRRVSFLSASQFRAPFSLRRASSYAAARQEPSRTCPQRGRRGGGGAQRRKGSLAEKENAIEKEEEEERRQRRRQTDSRHRFGFCACVCVCVARDAFEWPRAGRRAIIGTCRRRASQRATTS